ncbi:ABC transporter ATP-binding protein [Edaphobacillus lindanitolerans]|uniref:Carnitine transport ATP-binding protein OpuCA n=1 Tax=Edaphobacillus lindanitolerans TaxID=550447 RepID=A0A1U7PNG6_9BACI|nr:ABC transporter ATP-binding protein [Edaphobacillus lindanitolerans]SIT72982.1 iron(III) transport system ATP-binding protein [Edaphobacillus lindanitolerans]
MLQLERISKQFNGKTVLHGIDAEIGTGEIVSLLGKSGSGKTTLLNIILGMESPDSGRVLFNGADMTRVPVKDRGFNIVFQDYALFPHLNAYENIIYGLKNRKVPLNKREIQDYIDFLELGPHLLKKVYQLSGGQKQRVALARTLVMKPQILLMDEPLSALDGVIKESIKARIRSIAKEFNLTTIIVTHDPEEALTMSDQIMIIDEGRVVQFGTPDNIIHSPVCPFVESFILRQLHIKRENIYALFGVAK